MKIDTFDHKALIGPPKIPGLPDSMVQNANPSANADTNTKKSNKKKKKNSNSSNNMAVKPYLDPDLDYDSPSNNLIVAPTPSSHSEQQTSDPAKKLRNLRKKLRDIETLEKKFADGAVANPEPEQLEKVARKPVMIEEIMALEAMVAKLSA